MIFIDTLPSSCEHIGCTGLHHHHMFSPSCRCCCCCSSSFYHQSSRFRLDVVQSFWFLFHNVYLIFFFRRSKRDVDTHTHTRTPINQTQINMSSWAKIIAFSYCFAATRSYQRQQESIRMLFISFMKWNQVKVRKISNRTNVLVQMTTEKNCEIL